MWSVSLNVQFVGVKKLSCSEPAGLEQRVGAGSDLLEEQTPSSDSALIRSSDMIFTLWDQKVDFRSVRMKTGMLIHLVPNVSVLGSIFRWNDWYRGSVRRLKTKGVSEVTSSCQDDRIRWISLCRSHHPEHLAQVVGAARRTVSSVSSVWYTYERSPCSGDQMSAGADMEQWQDADTNHICNNKNMK